MYQPWLARWYPSLTPQAMLEPGFRWSTYLAMWDSLKEQ